VSINKQASRCLLILAVRFGDCSPFFPLTAASIFIATFAAHAEDAGAFHEVETKYIFGNFTVGSSTGIEGEKAFEPETEANFGKGGGGHYGVSQTTLEYEFTPTLGSEGVVNVRALAPGRYEFFDDFHQEARGTLVVE
jgi:hypothetical protein